MAPKKSIQYILYGTLCIVSLVIALLVFWWITGKPYTVEDFSTQMPYMVLVGLTGTGEIYYADVDVPMNPKWISSGITGVGELAGSYGKLYTVAPGGSVPKYGAYDSATQTAMNGGTVTQISVDDNEAIGGTNGTSYLYSAAGTSSLTSVTASAKQVSLAGRMGYYIGEDGKLYFSGNPANPSTTTRIMIDPGTSWKQVSFDGTVVCAIKTDGTLWCADKNISVAVGTTQSYGTAPYITTVNTGANFTSTSTPVALSYISLKASRLVAIGNDNKLYYTNSYKAPSLSWATVPTQPYDLATGLAVGSPVTFSKVIMMYPRHDARRKRFLGSASSCNSNEQQIGNFCYLPCVSGRNPRGTSCPYKARHIDATASCPRGYDFINNGCYGECPPGYTANNQMCRGPSTPAATRPQANVTPQRYSCPSDGSVSGRYVRVRPTTLIANNKLCISKIVVKDSAGRILSCASSGTGSGSGTCSGTGSGSGSSSIRAYATDGTCIDTPIGGTSCGVYSSYISGGTYDRDADGGKTNRSANLYWELDLGSIKPIKTIEFTGCSYQGANAGSSVAVGTPNADQITGMRIEVLYNSNSTTTAPNASRTLGLAKTQTITFNYINVDADEPTRCYDNCPSINGVSSIDQGDSTCVSASGGIAPRSITAPRKVSEPVCGPARRPDGTIYGPPISINGVLTTLTNWQTDPSDPKYVLSCDGLPGSVLVPQSITINAPQILMNPVNYEPVGFGLYIKSGTSDFSSRTNIYGQSGFSTGNTGAIIGGILDLLGLSSLEDITNRAFNPNTVKPMPQKYETSPGQQYTNTETPYVCVVPSKLICPNDSELIPNQNICKVKSSVEETFTLGSRGGAYTCQQYFWNKSNPRTNSTGAWCEAGDFLGGTLETCIPYVSCSTPTHRMSMVTAYTALNLSEYLYTNPKVVEGESIRRPDRQQAKCKCLLPNGSLDTSAFIYKGQCMKCSSTNDVFYPKGVTTVNTWGERILNTFLATSGTNSQGTISSLESTQFLNIEAAKATCEIYPECTGITQSLDANGQSFYTIGIGQPLSSTSSPSSSSSPSPSSSTWLISRGAASTAITGDFKGQEFSSKDIPQAFSDDYVSSTLPIRSVGSSIEEVKKTYNGAEDMITYFKSMLGQASAPATVIANLERPDLYYSLIGTIRKLQDTTPTSIIDTGICVGPCDSMHSMYDPIQMVYNINNKIYSLQGTTCHDATKIIIDKPSIPAINTPQIGNTCPPYVHTDSTANPREYTEQGSQCIEQCAAGSELDQNGNCVKPDIPRTSIVPNYACPTGFTELDMICIYPNPCESGHTLNGEYCEPPVSIVPTTGGSTTINCTRTSYGYSSNRGGSSTSVNKWLCDSSEDLNALIAGPAASSSTYIGPNDIVCVADDPTTGMYYCQSIADAKNKVDNGMRENVTKVCTNLTKAYYDLSNNLNILSSARTNAQNTTTQMAAIQRTLLGVYTSICSSTAGSSPLCNQMASQLDSLSQNVNSGSSRVSGVLNPIQVAMASRDTLVAQMTKFQCSY